MATFTSSFAAIMRGMGTTTVVEPDSVAASAAPMEEEGAKRLQQSPQLPFPVAHLLQECGENPQHTIVN